MTKRRLYDRGNGEDCIAYHKSRLKSSDRGLVIQHHAILDNELEMALRTVLKKKSSTTDEMLTSGALSTFSAKCKLSYCMELIDKDFFNDLEVLGRIRNLFAHEFDTTHDDERIVELLGSLNVLNNLNSTDGLLESIRDKSNKDAHETALTLLGIELNNIWFE